jgi:hypothetical protein
VFFGFGDEPAGVVEIVDVGNDVIVSEPDKGDALAL